MATADTKPQKRSLEERLSFALANRTRIEILAALNEASYTTSELAKIVGQTLSATGRHVKELLKDGAIEIAATRRARALDQNVYRAISMPVLTQEEFEEWPVDKIQELMTLVLQSSTAEALASLAAGKMATDPLVHMMWRWHTVDAEGHAAIADALIEARERIMEIESESAARTVGSGDTQKTVIVSTFAFQRSRRPVRPD